MAGLRTRARRGVLLGALVLVLAGAAGAQPMPDASDRSTEFATALGDDTLVATGERVEEDLLAIGGNLTVDGEAGGDAVALDGDVVVRGLVAGDALSIGGRVRLARGARVEGNAFSLFGGVDVAEGATVGGRVRSLAPLPPGEKPGYFSVGWSRPVLLARFLGLVFWFLAALIATFAAPETVARSAVELGRHPLRLAGIGLLLAGSFALSLVLGVWLIPVFVGIPLLVLLVLAGAALGALSLAATFHAVGERISERLGERALNGYAQVLGGALVFCVLHFVPVLGTLVWLLGLLGGAGAVVAVRLGGGRARTA